MIRIAILGAGKIAITMANTLNGMKEKGVRFSCYAIGARDLERAEAFAKEYGFEKAYGSYEEMLADENVDLVYVATPH
ncbi:MAG: Gfo/Idh/MocA family oxidoreductase, partial [Lachnospiraceae bacterium]|nr:Gfo/Idh/MocA family oxidoreductase [Lachnospiraceae bacterium]